MIHGGDTKHITCVSSSLIYKQRLELIVKHGVFPVVVCVQRNAAPLGIARLLVVIRVIFAQHKRCVGNCRGYARAFGFQALYNRRVTKAGE